jgi:TnpA family transposase
MSLLLALRLHHKAGKIRKTIFLCHYLHNEAVRREVQAGLNIIENWNSANGFIFLGKVASRPRTKERIRNWLSSPALTASLHSVCHFATASLYCSRVPAVMSRTLNLS